MIDGRELEGLERADLDWSGYDIKADPDYQHNLAIQNHEDKVNEIEGVTVYSYTPLEDKSAGLSLPDIDIDWEAVGNFALDLTPAGDVRDMYEGVRDGDYLKAAMGATSLGMTFVAPGSGQLAKLAGKSLLKKGAREFAENAAEWALKEAAEEGFTKSSMKLGREVHDFYKIADHAPELGRFKEFREIPGIRPDFVDFSTKTIYELKPFNMNGLKTGTKQLENYKNIFEKTYGGNWNTVLHHY